MKPNNLAKNIAYHLFRSKMASPNVRSILMVVLSVLLVAGGVYLIDPTLFGLVNSSENFTDASAANYMNAVPPQYNAAGPEVMQANTGAMNAVPTPMGGMAPPPVQMPAVVGAPPTKDKKEPFANLNDVTGPSEFDNAQGPAGCYPRDQLTPGELLPKDPNSVWAQQNPMGTGSLKGKNFLSAGALIGVNTVGQTLRNANYQLRSEPPNPQVPVTVFNNSTIEPDTNRRDLEIS